MLFVPPESKTLLENALVALSLDDVAVVVEKGHEIEVVLPCFGDECLLVDSLEFDSVVYSRTFSGDS